MFKILTFITNLISVIAIPIINTLFSMNTIDKDQFTIFMGVAGGVLVLNTIIVLFPDRDTPQLLQKKMPSANTLLKALIEEYRKAINDQKRTAASKKLTIPVIRANVMVLKYGFLSSHMQIAFEATQDSGVRYDVAEKKIKWRMGLGAVGYVWQNGVEQCFCSTSTEWQGMLSKLSQEQQKAVGAINSIISVPIFDEKGKKIIAIISLDSESKAIDSFFEIENVKAIVRNYALVLKPLLSDNGASSTGK